MGGKDGNGGSGSDVVQVQLERQTALELLQALTEALVQDDDKKKKPKK
ncbi:MAG: hypothetical protein ETSY1_41600 [Candidatus Entotheonella factor]|uniref:Uncharacterized protein n=1 Tax=Entotheonella factor TaxID=1429438 RepID=W4L4D0_ENTF1|nr:MAG: hypothetical protein ETSY1_41600 [Candidatus Entotheonella factor]